MIYRIHLLGDSLDISTNQLLFASTEVTAMKLTYRGLNYNYQPVSTDIDAQEMAGKYRGKAVTFRSLKQSPVHEETHDLIYRGVHFNG
jgi:predicted thioesterase